MYPGAEDRAEHTKCKVQGNAAQGREEQGRAEGVAETRETEKERNETDAGDGGITDQTTITTTKR